MHSYTLTGQDTLKQKVAVYNLFKTYLGAGNRFRHHENKYRDTMP